MSKLGEILLKMMCDDRMIDQMIEESIDWLIESSCTENGLVVQLIYWLIDWLRALARKMNLLFNWSIDWLIDWELLHGKWTCCSIDLLIDWLIESSCTENGLVVQLIYWLIDWLRALARKMDLLFNWFIDWLESPRYFSQSINQSNRKSFSVQKLLINQSINHELVTHHSEKNFLQLWHFLQSSIMEVNRPPWYQKKPGIFSVHFLIDFLPSWYSSNLIFDEIVGFS